MLTEENFEDLKVKGYTVAGAVITQAECDEAVKEYRHWLEQFGDDFPQHYNSIVKNYKTGHLDTTWKLRLRTKPVFAQLWKTEKLLTSFDAIAIGRPPEEGQESFQVPGEYWLHSDQHAKMLGLHAYQGALYLEEQCNDDWTFQVMEGSHNFLKEYFETNKDPAVKESFCHYILPDDGIEFFKEAGCNTVRVAVPKGGLVLWDSRLIHANARPLKNRKHPGRWRFVSFVSMTPAIWASAENLAKHKQAYNQVQMTTHWSSQELRPHESFCPNNIVCPEVIPDIATSDEARRLAGDIPYDFNDGLPNGSEYTPRWQD